MSDNDWTFVIVTHEVLPTGEVLVHGRLTVLGISKDAFGRGQQAVNRETGEVVSTADAYKAAASDCIKRCARLLGVGAYLYSDDPAEEPEPAQAGSRKVKEIQGKTSRPTQAHPPAPEQHNTSDTRVTQKQLSAIWNIGRKAGHNADAIRQYSHEMYGAFPEYLTRKQASDFITELSASVDGHRRVG